MNQTGQETIGKVDTPKKPSGRIWGLIGSIAVVLIAFIMGISIYSAPSNRMTRQLDLGNRYLDELRYEQAIAAFDQVIAIDPMNVEAYLGKAQAYIGMDDISMAIHALREGYEQTSKNAEIGEGLIQNYLLLAKSYIDAGNGDGTVYATTDMIEAYEKAIEVLTDGYEIVGDQRLKEELDKIQDMYQKALEWLDYVSSVESTLRQIAYYCLDEDYDRVFELMQSVEYERVLERVEELEQVHRISTEYGEIGIYQVDSEIFGNYMIYYGEFEGDSRQGQGVWLGYYENNNYIAQGTWDADMPQGDFEVREWLGELADDVTYRVIGGNVTDGLWDGNVEWAFESVDQPTSIYPVSFERGHWIIIRQDDDGTYEVSEKGLYIYPKDLDELWGIVGFATSY